jgi:single-stranded DNA-binding protein
MSKTVKVPFLNIVTIAGQAVDKPYQINRDGKVPYSFFSVAVKSYAKGRKPITTIVGVICRGDIAEAVNRRLEAGDAVIVSGSLQNHERKIGSAVVTELEVAAANIQFLTSKDGSLDDRAD